MKRLAAALAMTAVLATGAVAAETAPLLSLKRVSLAAGVNHRWEPEGRTQFLTGVYAAYNVTPHLSLVGSTAYLHTAERLEHNVGIRIRIWQGSK